MSSFYFPELLMRKIFTFQLIVLLALAITVPQEMSAQGVKPTNISLESVDTLFSKGQWEKASAGYEVQIALHPEKIKALTWNRLGYCYHNLGNYVAALKNYNSAIASQPSPSLKPYLMSRMARSYAQLHDNDKAFAWLDSAVRAGYSSLNELDTLADYNSLRKEPRFEVCYKKVYTATYPCAANPKNREFDFWIGEWNVFRTGSDTPVVGHSLIQNVSKGCLVLENWTALRGSHEGKSMNFYDPSTGKWEQVWMGSGVGDLIKFENGEYRDSAMRFTFAPIQSNGQKATGRLTFFNQGPDQVRQFSEQSLDQGKTWQTIYDFTYVRKE